MSTYKIGDILLHNVTRQMAVVESVTRGDMDTYIYTLSIYGAGRLVTTEETLNENYFLKFS